jgi:hypothetical protein
MNEPITITIIIEDSYEVCYYVANGITFDGVKDIDASGRYLCRFILTSEKQVRVVQVLQENLKGYGAFINLGNLRLEMRGIQERMQADIKRLTRSRKRRVRV